jgi:hypothetical protein
MAFTKAIVSAAAILTTLAFSINFQGQDSAQGQSRPASHYAFRNAATEPPPNPTTPVFKLSRNYPNSPPPDCTGQPSPCTEFPWLNVPVNFAVQFPASGGGQIQSPTWHGEHWDEYLQDILDYVKKGQDPDLRNEVGWQTDVDGKTRWFNVPWMAYDPTAGREYVHGTTNERTASLGDLINSQPHTQNFLHGTTPSCEKQWPYGFESWSVGYYNEYGGYALGQAIPSTGIPQVSEYLGSPLPAGLPFPVGTVVVKVLTSSAPLECVPYLKGSPAWQVDRHKLTKDKGYVCKREVQISHVVQVDVAVVDPRSPIRWVYGTFAYDGNRPGKTFWDHLVPIGLQWGSDPWSYPAVPMSISLPLQQTVLNPDIHIYEHFGCLNRLAGPVDNSQSSCTSCHASAYAAPKGAPSEMGVNVPPSFGFTGMCQAYSLDNSAYFQNQTPPQRFPGGRFPDAFGMDTSLQLEVAFTQYGYFNTNHAPQPCTNPNQLNSSPAMKRMLQVIK